MIVIAPGARVSPLADIEDSVRGSKITIEDGALDPVGQRRITALR